MIDKKYQELLQDILDNGVEKDTRNGKTISVFGRQIRHDMKTGFPLLTTKRMYWKGIVTELLWFLRGDTNIKWLVENGCNIWNGDAYQAYKTKYGYNDIDAPLSMGEFISKIKTDSEFAEENGELGPVYGQQWRRWRTYPNEYGEYESNPIDQIQNLIEQLKDNPDSRRLLVSAWAVHDLPKMVLPPCHYGFQVYTRELSLEERFRIAGNDWPPSGLPNQGIHFMNEKNIPKRAISLMYNTRSQDVPLGTPFNIASYGLLLEIIAKEVNMVPDELITNMGDCHIYKNQIDGIKEQLTREPYPLPKVLINNGDVDNNGVPFTKSMLDGYDITDFELVDYQSHPTIKMPLSN